jgi:predicted O-linked N-acetylglucosamine transferase (SPINDLY family)
LDGLIRQDPHDGEALHMLAGVAYGMKNMELARSLVERAISSNRHVAKYHFRLGNILKVRGDLAGAIECYKEALTLRPNFLAARYNLGVVYEESDLAGEAVRELQQVLAERPAIADAHLTLGNAYHRLGDSTAAVKHYKEAIALAPNSPVGYYNLANILTSLGRDEEAVKHLHLALSRKPAFAEAHSVLARLLAKKGRLQEALTHRMKVVALLPDSAEAHADLAGTYKALHRQRLAIQHYRRALDLTPGSWWLLMSLGSVLMEQSRVAEAAELFERALELCPDSAELHSHLGGALRAQGRVEEAIALKARAVELSPNNPSLWSSLLLSLNYSSQVNAVEVFEWHKRFDRFHAAPLMPPSPPAQRHRPQAKIRVGYVSPDFRRHSVAFFIEPVIENHARDRWEITAYYNQAEEDDFTERIREYCDRWRNIFAVSDDDVAAMIRDDRIDILVDLSGHTGNNRLLVFARRAAPVQVTWLGYPNTTGLRAMDYRLTDSVADPPGLTEHLYTEELIRIPGSFCCYSASRGAPEVGELPAFRNRHVTFGSFNNYAKVSGECLAAFTAVLKAVPKSRLALKGPGLGDQAIRDKVQRAFIERGIGADRLDLIGRDRSTVEHLQRYNGIDIALDTFPYNGVTTTCEAAWMGVPVVTLAGDAHASRVGASLMTVLGLSALIARSRDGYVRIAVSLANDLRRVEKLRMGMRERMAASPLMDGATFTRKLERAYEGMWDAWCASGSGD